MIQGFFNSAKDDERCRAGAHHGNGERNAECAREIEPHHNLRDDCNCECEEKAENGREYGYKNNDNGNSHDFDSERILDANVELLFSAARRNFSDNFIH